ncbi:Opi1-domain-containing protein [Violaceomyces palustris]|uniref:Opi1-domain-containing protein n=1 Tax=Violaceomyces palustris TaxID=1673888 RepID=A0ACD0NP62_9BASI|nr:Opi1-domain-containing protein [Violaceomyces palustris]
MGDSSKMSHEERWNSHRSEAEDAPTPAATPASPYNEFEDSPGTYSAARSRAGSSAQAPFYSAESSAAPTPPKRSGGVDAEDEDVKIAIMALGAMKSLDGKARASAGSESDTASAGTDVQALDTPTRTSSAMSNSSVTSTALSSPSSTPATELTQDSDSTSPPVNLRSVAATLADLPADFQFPAVIQDENGNEVRVDSEMLKDADFLKRVSHLPIVRGTLRAYELGKQKSRMVKYGADFVESSVKTISRPVVSRLGASLGEKGVEQLDDFACRQLDRLYPASATTPTREEKQRILSELEERERTEWQHMDEEEKSKRKKAFIAAKMEEKEREAVVSELRQRKGKAKANEAVGAPPSDSDRSDPVANGKEESKALVKSGEARGEDQVSSANAAKTSRWGSMLVEAGVTAGGLSAAMSEESMKSLKYCLQWLQYATAHIEHQITVLRDLIVKLNHGELDMSSTAAQNLTNIKGDVVNTIRGVVDVVSKYAGGALPEPARNSVKAFILSLPARWANVNRSSAANTPGGYFGGSPSSPSFSAAHLSGGASAAAQVAARRGSTSSSRNSMQAVATAQAANKVLTLAIESLDILRSVTIVFGESLDRADLWVERLRVLGIQRKRQHEAAAAERIEGSAGSSSGGRPHWENARGYSMNGRSGSPSADSDVSMATTGSTKRRRVKNRNSGSGRTSHSPGPGHHHRVSHSPMMSDDENLTETEKGGTTTTVSSSSVVFHHGAVASASATGGSAAHRRKTRASIGGSKYHPSLTPTFAHSPLHPDAGSEERS